LRTLEARCLADRPAEVATLLATGAGRSFATGAAFERALDLEVPAHDRRAFAVYDGNRVVAALPARLERRFGGTWLRAQPHGTPAGPVFDPALGEDDRRAAAGALWGLLAARAQAEGWLGGDATLCGPAAEDEALLPPAALGAVRRESAHVIPLADGLDAWQATLDKRARQMVRRARERGVTAGLAESPADLEAVYGQFLEQARAWGLKRVRPLSFYRALLEPPTEARLWIGRYGGETVCGVLVFVLPEESYVWWSGSAPSARPVNAFAATLATVVEECGSRRVSLGFSGGRANLTAFKRQLGGTTLSVPIVELTPRPKTPWHMLLVAGRNAARRRALARSTGSE
jgi:hypothetical protein